MKITDILFADQRWFWELFWYFADFSPKRIILLILSVLIVYVFSELASGRMCISEACRDAWRMTVLSAIVVRKNLCTGHAL